MNAAFERVVWENNPRTIASILFRSEEPYRFEAGQYAVVTVPHENPDRRGISRTMTISSSPEEELLKITFRVYPEGGSTYKRALLHMKPGDTARFDEALGDLVLPLDTSVPLVWVAGGVGIASFSGMMQYLVDHRETRDISLHYAVSDTEDIVLQEPFDTYAAQYGLKRTLYIPTEPNASRQARDHADAAQQVVARRLKKEDILSDILPDSLIYLSGTQKMVESFQHELTAAGILRQRIVFDYYDGYNELY